MRPCSPRRLRSTLPPCHLSGFRQPPSGTAFPNHSPCHAKHDDGDIATRRSGAYPAIPSADPGCDRAARPGACVSSHDRPPDRRARPVTSQSPAGDHFAITSPRANQSTSVSANRLAHRGDEQAKLLQLLPWKGSDELLPLQIGVRPTAGPIDRRELHRRLTCIRVIDMKDDKTSILRILINASTPRSEPARVRR
jgi:hypothetical protein